MENSETNFSISEHKKKNAHNRKYLIFKLNGNDYGVSLADVKEVIGVPQMIPVPQAPNYLLGLINLRGKVVSAIDLKVKLNMPKGAEIKRPAMILVECETTVVACLVDIVSEVVTIKEEEIEKDMNGSVQTKNHYIEGIARFNDRPMIIIINLKQIAQTGLNKQDKKISDVA